MSRLAKAVAVALVALAVAPALAAAAPERRVLIAIVPRAPTPGVELARLKDAGLVELGLMTASVGTYSQQQTLLDITQGARVPLVNYAPGAAPALELARTGTIVDWPAVVRRAASADAGLAPGALASGVPRGAGYVADGRTLGTDGVLAAGRRGRVAAVSLGPPSSLVVRVREMLERKRLVVAELAGPGQLRALVGARPRGEFVLAVEAPPPTAAGVNRPPLLLAVGAAGLAARPGALSSGSTRTDGLIAATDLAPTVLRWLGVREPATMIGQPLRVAGARTLASLAAYANRLAVLGGRRLAVLAWFLLAWLALALLALVRGRGLSEALRLGGLAALWAPAVVLAAAMLAPSAAVEGAIVVGGSFGLALANDRLVAWPRAAAIPAAATLVLYAGDLLAGSGLIERSLLGSDPISGSRFFGAGNELVTVLTVELLVALAALRPRRRLAALLAVGGALMFVLAWGRAGANVGTIFTVGGAVAASSLSLARGRLTARRLTLAAEGIAGALGLLVALDLLSGGGAQLTSQVLGAHSVASAAGALARRASETWHAFAAFPMPLAVVGCLAGALLLARGRERLPEPWAACLAGVLAGALLGSLVADSGPRVLLVGCAGAVCVLAYLLAGTAETAGDRRLYKLLTQPLAVVSTLDCGSGIPRPDPPELSRR